MSNTPICIRAPERPREGGRAPTRAPARAASLAALGLVLSVGACEPVAHVVLERAPGETPHEEYRLSLEDAGLLGTALGSEWLQASREALEEPQFLSLPYREEGLLPLREATALGFSISADRGQRIRAELEMLESEEDPALFVDLFRVAGGEGGELRHLVASGPGSRTVDFEARVSGEYLLRLQPELLRGGRYRLTVELLPGMAFPVEGSGMRDIGSGFGASRDGGRREHHGVDVFASRGTPVVSATEGTVRRVSETPIGGKVVWIRDEAVGRSLYYAHLDSQLVAEGARVQPGDTLGLVGNTGNARTTPPHLHFGVYAQGEGPIDPMPFIRDPGGPLPPLPATLGGVGEWGRTISDGARVRSRPTTSSTTVAELPQNASLEIVAAVGDWRRVRLPDGRRGFVSASLVEGIEELLDEEEILALAQRRNAR